MPSRRLGVSLLLFFALGAAALWSLDRSVKGGPEGGTFTLQSKSGPRSLEEIRGDKAVILYFGFTNCPDVCPMSLHKLSGMLKKLTPEERAKLQTVFVSVDYRKDTGETAQRYVEVFVPEGVGLGGTKEEIDTVVKKYGASYLIEEDAKSALGYGVQHSTSFFLIDRRGRFREKLPSETLEPDFLKALRELI